MGPPGSVKINNIIDQFVFHQCCIQMFYQKESAVCNKIETFHENYPLLSNLTKYLRVVGWGWIQLADVG